MTNEQLVGMINDENRKECMEQLYKQNTGLIATIAQRYVAFAEMDDLMQEGYFALCKACDHWDECKGMNFSTYACYWIKSHLHRYVSEQNIIRIPEHEKELILSYNRLISEHIAKTSKGPSDRYLMLHLGISHEQLEQLKKAAQMIELSSLNAALSANEDVNLTLEDTIRDPQDQFEDLEEKIQNDELAKVEWGIVDSLEQDQRFVIKERYQNNSSTADMAARMGLTVDKVRTVEKKAMRELRKYKNKKKLEPFHVSTDLAYSVGISCSGLHSYMNSWTSSPERAVIMAETRGKW